MDVVREIIIIMYEIVKADEIFICSIFLSHKIFTVNIFRTDDFIVL